MFAFSFLSFWVYTAVNPSIPEIQTQAKEACIKNNGVPIIDPDGQIIDCKTYPIFMTIAPTPKINATITLPTAGASATRIPLRASSAVASNSGENQ